MDVLLQAVCLTLNTTSCADFPTVTPELIGNGINYEPIIPKSTSDVEKGVQHDNLIYKLGF